MTKEEIKTTEVSSEEAISEEAPKKKVQYILRKHEDNVKQIEKEKEEKDGKCNDT